MELTTLVYTVLAVLVGGGFLYMMLRRNKDTGAPLTAANVVARVQDAVSIAQTLVQAAEQLAETGQIDRGARFQYVFSRLRELFPNLSEDTLIALIEGAVWAVNQGAALLTPPADQ